MGGMPAGIRTQELRKVFNTPPPLGAGGGFGPIRKSKDQPAREIVALDGLSLDVEGGEIFGLLGPNGAGKSTTVGILTTRVRPTDTSRREFRRETERQRPPHRADQP